MPASFGLDQLLETDTRSEATPTRSAAPRVPGLTVLWHVDPERVGEIAPLPALTAGREERLSRREPDFGQPGTAILRPLADPYLSRRPIFFVPAAAGAIRVDTRDSSTQVELDGRTPITSHELSAAEIADGVVLLLAGRLALLLHFLDPTPGRTATSNLGLIGESAAMVTVRREILQVTDLDIPILLRGETGTGKELVAAAIHSAGPRAAGPYVAVNMAAIPPSLAAAELFGATRGAFTGADRARTGSFRQADGGTLFLDEVAETPPEVQALLLRALETREVQPLGSDRAQKVDARLVAATDTDLETAVDAERFRAPLLHRLAGYQIRLPPLRQRREDIGRLTLFLLRQELARVGQGDRLTTTAPEPYLPARIVARLAAHDWPGNVRQLRNILRHLLISCRGEASLAPDLPLPFDPQPTAAPAPAVEPSDHRPAGRRDPANIGDDELIAALRQQRWQLAATARQLGISRSSLYLLIETCPRVRKAVDLERDEIVACDERHGGDLRAMAAELEVSQRGLLRRMKDLGVR